MEKVILRCSLVLIRIKLQEEFTIRQIMVRVVVNNFLSWTQDCLKEFYYFWITIPGVDLIISLKANMCQNSLISERYIRDISG